MNIKKQRLLKLIGQLNAKTGKGITVNAKLEQSIYNRDAITVVVESSGTKVVDYYSTNVDEAREALKNFLSLLSFI